MELNDRLLALDFFKENLLQATNVCYFKFESSNLTRRSVTLGRFLCCKHYLTKPINFYEYPFLSAKRNMDSI